ncbi:MAG: hypothetical protein ABIR92_11685 [Gemmatimonadaceae bacterium]
MQTTKWLGTLAVGALVGTYGLTASAAPPDMDNIPLILSGCVVAGEARDSYLLTNVTVDSTTMAPSHAFYRFNTTKGLKAHVGHRVEVKGKADFDDADKGKVKVRTDGDGNTTTKISSERRTVTVGDSAWFGSLGAKKLDAEIVTYKFDVDSVKRLQGNCESASSAH